jgi:alkaline phosphatase
MSGLRVGVVTNTRVTHATPASFISHCGDRNLEYNIANQEARNVTYDLLFGGGKQYFDSRRPDGQDLIAHMQSKGFNFYQTNAEMQSARLPALGLFADSHLDYEIDRKLNASSTQPSHSAMVKKALELLSATTENFVLIIESGKIDLSSHNNDVRTLSLWIMPEIS